MDPREERLLRNEIVFRRVNERLKDLGESFSIVTEEARFVCECADTSCTELVEMTLEEYEQVRAQPGRFFMPPGHVDPEIETVVDDNGRYVVAEKPPGEVTDAAAADDERSF